MEQHPILLFDGVCNLCNGFVQWLIKRDSKRLFRYAALQSETGQRLLHQYQLPQDEIKTVVLIDKGKVYTHAEVSLRVGQRLGGVWVLTGILYLVPRPIRTLVYNWIARNRYRWFGKEESCMIPTPELKQLFLN